MSELRTKIQQFMLACRRAYKPDWKWHNFPSKKSHDKFIDKKVNNCARTIREFYHGYPTTIKCSTTSELYKLYARGDYQKFHSVLNKWLADHCFDEYRYDYHRTMLHQGEECMDELGGSDYLFVAFMDEQDAVMFTLRWA